MAEKLGMGVFELLTQNPREFIMPRLSFGERVRLLMAVRGMWTDVQAAASMNINRGHLKNVLNGRNPTVDDLAKLVIHLGAFRRRITQPILLEYRRRNLQSKGLDCR